MRQISFCLLFLLSLNFGPCSVHADETHPFSIQDMLAMDRISDSQVSPDGSQIVFTLRTTDLEADKGRTDLWLVGTDGGGLRRLTSHEGGDSNPRWSPDRKSIYFLSTRSDSSQVWRISIDGGEAEQITDLPLDAANLLVSPDGNRIAVTMEVFPGLTPQATRKKLDEIEERKATGKIYERIFVRHWDTWKDGRRSHLFVMPIAGGEAIDLMRDMDADTPSKPFGGPEEITFTPDSKSVIFSARDVGAEEPWSTRDAFCSIITLKRLAVIFVHQLQHLVSQFSGNIIISISIQAQGNQVISRRPHITSPKPFWIEGRFIHGGGRYRILGPPLLRVFQLFYQVFGLFG